MTKSALQIARAAYQPKLPKALASGAVKAVAGTATESVACLLYTSPSPRDCS